MPDQTQREQFATAILDAMRNSVGEYDTPYIDGSSLEWACLDGRVDMLAAVDTLLAAGWRPPARVIETDVELAGTVPDGSIVRSNAGTIACRFDYGAGVVFGDDRPFPWGSLDLPVTVLWTPKNGDNR